VCVCIYIYIYIYIFFSEFSFTVYIGIPYATENDIFVLLYTALNAPMTWMLVLYETQMELHLKSIFCSWRMRV